MCLVFVFVKMHRLKMHKCEKMHKKSFILVIIGRPYELVFFLGRWTGNHFTCRDLCSASCIMHVLANDSDQEVHSQMDYGLFHFLLLYIHCSSILSRILYADSWRHHFGIGRCAHVECKVHIFDSGTFIIPYAREKTDLLTS